MFWLILIGGILLIVAWLIRRQQLINLAKKLSGIEIKKHEWPEIDFSNLQPFVILAIMMIISVFIFSTVMHSISNDITGTPLINPKYTPYLVIVVCALSAYFMNKMYWRSIL